jgi:colanic acid/amylovoran biosynthesis protein
VRRYLIINAYSARNAGDAAIILSAVHLLRSRGHGIFSISSRYLQEDAPFYGAYGISTVPPVIPFPHPGESRDAWRALRFFLGLTVVTLLAIAYRASLRISIWLARTLRAHGFLHLVQSDVIIIAGGGYLYSHVTPGRPNLTLLHHMATVKVAALLQKSMVMMPQSIGPLSKQLDRWVVVWGLSAVEPIVVREHLDRVAISWCVQI